MERNRWFPSKLLESTNGSLSLFRGKPWTVFGHWNCFRKCCGWGGSRAARLLAYVGRLAGMSDGWSTNMSPDTHLQPMMVRLKFVFIAWLFSHYDKPALIHDTKCCYKLAKRNGEIVGRSACCHRCCCCSCSCCRCCCCCYSSSVDDGLGAV